MTPVSDTPLEALHATAAEIFSGALKACNIATAFDRRLRFEGNTLRRLMPDGSGPATIDLSAYRRIFVIALGKAAGPMLEVLLKKAATQAYEPDCSLVPDDVGGGRPLPWMCYEIALRLKIFPLESFVKVGDTVADVEEGLNAGMWTVGVVRTGNMVGLTPAQLDALAPAEREARLEAGRERLREAGTHYLIDNVSDFDPVFDEIDARLERGERP